MKNKLTYTIVAFLLLIPFRLPISILMIKGFEWLIAMSTDQDLPVSVVATNVIITKAVYNIALSSLFVYNIEKMSIEKKGRRAKGTEGDSIYWWTFVIACMLLSFIMIDAFSMYSIFFNG